MSVVGIDIGTSFSKVAVAKNKAISVVPNDLTKLLTPTLITYLPNERLHGEGATSSWARNSRQTVAQVKRLVGRQFDDPTLQEEFTRYFMNAMQPTEDGRVGVVVQTSQGEQLMLPEQILAGYLAKLKQFTSVYLDMPNVKDCVLACPSYFDEAQRRALMTAADLAELKVLKLINETTATALGYGIMRSFPADTTTTVLFVDVGYAATQVALVDYQDRTLTVAGTAANPFAGGRDIDNLLFEHFREQFESKHKMKLSDRPKAVIRLRREVTKMKKILSGNRDCVTMIECFVDEIDLTLNMSRAELAERSEAILQQICQPISDVLAITGKDPASISAVEIVGGCSRIPYVQSALTAKLAEIGCGTTTLSQTLNGDECVARGATLMCAMLSPNYQVRKFEVKDISTFPVAVEYSKNDSLRCDLIAPPNRLTPWTAKVSFNQQSFGPGAAFPFTLLQPEQYTLKGESVTIQYPMKTERRIGEFYIGVPDLTPDLVQEPKIKVLVKQDKHGLISGPPLASLIEYVEAPPEPEPEPKAEEVPAPTETPATDESTENKEENDAANENNDEKQPREDSTTQPMDVDEDSTAATETTEPEPMDTDEPASAPEAMETDAPAAEDEKTEEAPKKKKKKIARTLAVRGRFFSQPEKEVFDRMFELEANLANDDRLVFETNERRNELESYIYDTRDRLHGDFREFMEDAPREEFINKLTETEDWLYDEGQESSKSSYEEKIKELRSVGDDVRSRFEEDRARPEVVATLKTSLGRYQRFVDSDDEKYDHIDTEEKEQVRSKVQEVDRWLGQKLIEQDKCGKTKDPALRVSDIQSQLNQLDYVCGPIMSKRKPTPQPEPQPEPEPPAENGDETKNDDADPMDQDAPAAEEPTGVDGIEVE